MTDDAEQVRARVVARYGELARAAAAGDHITDAADAVVEGCFGAAAYDDVAGLPEAAVRASLGCGNPVAVAALRPGETVLDLGSGGGIDVLLSARRVGPGGKAYGLDAAPEMVGLARANAAAAGAANAEFLLGVIEDIPLPDGHVDAVISKGVSDVIASSEEYRQQLLAAGFTQVAVTPVSDAGGGLRSAIIQAVRPAAPDGVLIRPMRAADAGQVLAIYQAGLDTGQASFETTAPGWDAFGRWRDVVFLERRSAV